MSFQEEQYFMDKPNGLSGTPLPEQGGFNERLKKLSFDFCKLSCEKYETLRGIYPNHRRTTGKDCSCGLEDSIRTLVLEEVIGENSLSYSIPQEMSESVYNRLKGADELRAEQRKKLGGTNGTK